jgi:N-acetylglucosamine-6-phosphate deacetylase
MRFTFHGARLVDAGGDLPNGDITIDGPRIVTVGHKADDPGERIDASGMIVMPGFIDVHTHGGGGFNLHTTTPEEILEYARWVPSTGVTSFLIGVVGTPDTLPEPQLRAAAAAVHVWRTGAQPLGIHMEGPYISVARRGAHLTNWLRLPSTEETNRVLAATDGTLRLVTLAPELPGASTLIARLVEAGVAVSMGHTDATYEQAREAIRLGATHLTHSCNAMRPLHHRDPGPLGAVAEAAHVQAELIADGIHVHPAMMRFLVRGLGPERMVVITDALAAAGIGDANFEFAGQPAQVICGAARLADGTLTGSVLTMEQALRNVIAMTGTPLPAAIGMLSANPARAAGAHAHKGRLQADYDADVLVLDDSLALQVTICRGRLAYATPEWQARLAALADMAGDAAEASLDGIATPPRRPRRRAKVPAVVPRADGTGKEG